MMLMGAGMAFIGWYGCDHRRECRVAYWGLTFWYAIAWLAMGSPSTAVWVLIAGVPWFLLTNWIWSWSR